MKPFRLLIDFEVLEFVQTLKAWQKREIYRHLSLLIKSPDEHKDLIEKDETGREYFVSLWGPFGVKYWIDEWEREVKVIAVRPRGRQK